MAKDVFPPTDRIIEDRVFQQLMQQGAALRELRFEQCTFERCDLSSADLGRSRFTECTFIGCDLSLVKLVGASLQQVVFRECKLMGVDFSVCSEMLFHITSVDCPMDHAVFEKRVMPRTRFTRCSLQGAVFEEADLQDAVFDDCDLTDAVFAGTDLRRADLTTVRGARIDPRGNDLRGTAFSVEGALALLSVFGVEVR
ncbi:MAG: pentapeptide repeat-containing protein [Flavobacteriales bacterium]|nr:pentapeptide repeat-containing protein [Flavobacteriales bacterium]MCB9166080.1 pentapeptide repeat-containing protein [Flavobacteriales bacterium]